MHEQRTSYNVAFAYSMRGPGFSLEYLDCAVNLLVARHETLRTTFRVPPGGSEPMQYIAEAMHIDVPLVQAAMEDVPRHMAAHAAHVFDLENGPLLKFTVLRTGTDAHVFLVNMHHAICDGWSIGVFFRDLHAFYLQAETGRAAELPPLAIQYADYAAAQRRRNLDAEREYWLQALTGYRDGLNLPYDKARPATRAWRAAVVRHAYPPALAAAVSRLSRECQSSLFMTLLASVAVVLQRYTERDDICIGTTVAGRDQVELEELIGFFVNILALRVDLGRDPDVTGIMAGVRRTVLDALEHQELPFEHVLNALQTQRDSSQIPLIPVMVRHQNFRAARTPPAGSAVEFSDVQFGERTTPSELDFQFAGDGDSLELTLEYAAPLFEESTIRRLIGLHQAVLEAMTARQSLRLSELPRHAAADLELLGRVRGEVVELGQYSRLVERFEAVAAQRPAAIGCEGWGGALSFAELNARANGIARQLCEAGCVAETRIAVIAGRSPELVCALLGIWKAGGCYVPIDSAFPRPYIERILQDANVQLVLAEPGAWERADLWLEGEALRAAAQESNRPAVKTPLGQLACLMYTSGSTAAPKGVMVPHAQIENWLQAAWRRWPFGAAEKFLQKTSPVFAVSVKELLSGLLAGVPQVMLTDEQVRDVALLGAAIERHGVTRLHLVPAHLKALLEGAPAGSLRSLQLIVTAGEALTREVAAAARRLVPQARLWNNYGCTELNDVSYEAVTDSVGASDFVPIGRPIANSECWVLDEQLQRVPVGAIGELHVASIGVARGYFGQPGLSAQRFLANPYGAAGSRLYKTGDLVRLGADGRLEYLGRRDHEVKVRGHRVDLRQVRQALADQAGVREVAVIGWPQGAASPELCAYVVAQAGSTLSGAQLREALARQLPTYMVPTRYQLLEGLPRLANGKLDTLSLPAPLAQAPGSYEAPRNELEQRLAGLFARVLGLERVGRHDNFFDLGGHSLLAAQLLALIREEWQLDLSMVTLIECRTLEALAATVDAVRCGVLTAQQSGPWLPLAGESFAPRLVCLHPVGGQVQVYSELAKLLAGHYVVGLQAHEPTNADSLEALAANYCDQLERMPAQSRGFRLLGWSSGGLLAAAMTEELERRGRAVEYLGLIDPLPIPRAAIEGGRLPLAAASNVLGAVRRRAFSVEETHEVAGCLEAHGFRADALTTPGARYALEALARHFGVPLAAGTVDYLLQRVEITRSFTGLLAGYLPRLPATARLYVAQAGGAGSRARQIECAQVHELPGDHYTLLQGEHARQLATHIRAHLGALV
jgi:amino acid adenylation domain-containing protein